MKEVSSKNYVDINDICWLFLKKYYYLNTNLKKILKEDYDNLEYIGVLGINPDKQDVIIILKEDYCNLKNRSERMIQFSISDSEDIKILGKHNEKKEEFYNKNAKSLISFLHQMKEENVFEKIYCSTFINNMNLYVDNNSMRVILSDDLELICHFSDIIEANNIYDGFKIKKSKKILKKGFGKEEFTLKELLCGIKVEKKKLPPKILQEIESDKLVENLPNIKKLQK